MGDVKAVPPKPQQIMEDGLGPPRESNKNNCLRGRSSTLYLKVSLEYNDTSIDPGRIPRPNGSKNPRPHAVALWGTQLPPELPVPPGPTSRRTGVDRSRRTRSDWALMVGTVSHEWM